MAFEVNITPEDIDALVKDTLMKASLGKMISESVAKTLSGYNSPVERAIQQYVGEIASDLIRERFSDDIKAAVAATIEARVTNEMLNKTVNVAVQRIERAAEDY